MTLEAPSEAYEVIRQAVVMATGLADGLVCWHDGPQPFASGTVVRLRIVSDTGEIGRAIEELTDAQDDKLARVLRQPRLVTVQAIAETLSAGPTDAACDVLALILDGLDFDGPEDPITLRPAGPRQVLAEGGVVFVDVPTTMRSVSRVVDGRVLTCYSVDVRFRYLRSRADTDIRTIGQVNCTLTTKQDGE